MNLKADRPGAAGGTGNRRLKQSLHRDVLRLETGGWINGLGVGKGGGRGGDGDRGRLMEGEGVNGK
jgi:hypothetical protein